MFTKSGESRFQIESSRDFIYITLGNYEGDSIWLERRFCDMTLLGN